MTDFTTCIRAVFVMTDVITQKSRPTATCWTGPISCTNMPGTTRCWQSRQPAATREFTLASRYVVCARLVRPAGVHCNCNAPPFRAILLLAVCTARVGPDLSGWTTECMGRVNQTAYALVAMTQMFCAFLTLTTNSSNIVHVHLEASAVQ